MSDANKECIVLGWVVLLVFAMPLFLLIVHVLEQRQERAERERAERLKNDLIVEAYANFGLEYVPGEDTDQFRIRVVRARDAQIERKRA